jgi:hypothetical protein
MVGAMAMKMILSASDEEDQCLNPATSSGRRC